MELYRLCIRDWLVNVYCMQSQLELLLQKLNRKRLVDWVEEMKLGKPAYDHLLVRLGDEGMTRWQRANALVALYRLKSHGNEQEAFAVFLRHAEHRDIRVRSQAVKLVAGTIKSHKFKEPFFGKGKETIVAALGLGLDRDTMALAKKVIAEQP
jgi:hypothetical protein